MQIIIEKDSKIESQRIELTNLRKKNFEFRSKNQELQDSIKNKPQPKKEAPHKNEHLIEDMHNKMIAITMQAQEQRQREKEIMMQVMMNSMVGDHSAEAEE